MNLTFDEAEEKVSFIVMAEDMAPTKASKGGSQVGLVLSRGLLGGLQQGTQPEWKRPLKALGRRSNKPAAAEAELRPTERTPAILQKLQQLNVGIAPVLRSRMLLRFRAESDHSGS